MIHCLKLEWSEASESYLIRLIAPDREDLYVWRELWECDRIILRENLLSLFNANMLIGDVEPVFVIVGIWEDNSEASVKIDF